MKWRTHIHLNTILNILTIIHFFTLITICINNQNGSFSNIIKIIVR